MSRIQRLILLPSILISCGLACKSARAQVQESMLFELTTDARSAALGGMVGAHWTGDLNAAAYNPLLLDSTFSGQVAIDYMNYFAGIDLASVNYAFRPSGKGQAQVGARFVNLGTFDELDAAGNDLGTFKGGEEIIYFGWKQSLDSTWSIGVQMFTGSRHLDREIALWAGAEFFAQGIWPARQLAAGVSITGLGYQKGWKGMQPTGWLPKNLQVSVTKGFQDAPFCLFLKSNHLEQWDIAPAGTYDDGFDPLTGEVLENKTFVFGDLFFRHLKAGTEISLGGTSRLWLGFDYRRRAEMKAGGRTGTNGFSIGSAFQIGKFELRIARNTYHFAGSSTHLGILFNPRTFQFQ